MQNGKLSTQAEVRKQFWSAAKAGAFGSLNVTPRRVTHYSGKGKMHNTDTRCAFVEFVDSLSKDNKLVDGLAEKVTL